MALALAVLVSAIDAGGASAYIYWANVNDGTIGRANQDGSGLTPSFISGANGFALAADRAHIYWTWTDCHGRYLPDLGWSGARAAQATCNGTIGRANLDGSNVTPHFIVTDFEIGPYGLAVAGAHIYWLNGHSIGRANINGTRINQNFITVAPRVSFIQTFGLAVDTTHIYWTNYFESPGTAPARGAIGRANLDGSGVNRHFITGLTISHVKYGRVFKSFPAGLAVDRAHIYWTNADHAYGYAPHGGTIGRANLDGTGANRQFITGTGLTNGGMAVDATHIYWPNRGSNFGGGSVGRANLNGTGVDQGFITAVSDPGTIAVDVGGPTSRPGGGGGSGVVAINAELGSSFNGTVGSFSGVGNPSSLSAWIDWGDGSIARGTVSASSTDPNGVVVSGRHTYWEVAEPSAGEPDGLRATVTLTDPTGGSHRFEGLATVRSTYSGLGDSYSSGEGSGWTPGNPPIRKGCSWPLYHDSSGSPVNTDYIAGAGGNPCVAPPFALAHGDTCHRSITAYAHVVQRELAVVGMTLTFTACSGAIIEDAYHPAGQVHDDTLHQGEQPQFSAVSPKTSLITLTFGGNNLKFADIAKDCVIAGDDSECLKYDRRMLAILGYDTRAGSASDGTFLPIASTTGRWTQKQSTLRMSLDSLYSWSLGTAGDENRDGNDLHDALVLLYRKLRAVAPGARILVLGYPQFFPPHGAGQPCEHFSDRGQQWINDRISLVDTVIRDATIESGVAQYVDVYGALYGHELCQGEHRFTFNLQGQVFGCLGSFMNGVDIFGGLVGTSENLHPNPCAHQREGDRARDAYLHPPGTSFSLGLNQSKTVHYQLPRGVSRLNVSVTWSTDNNPTVTLTGPDGLHADVLGGTVDKVWDVPFPAAGTWTLKIINHGDPNDRGQLRGLIVEATPTLPRLPPEGQVKLVHFQHNLFDYAGEFKASVNTKSVPRYTWYDDKGNQQTDVSSGGQTMKMSSGIGVFKIILRTDGDHEFRYSVWRCIQSGCSEVADR